MSIAMNNRLLRKQLRKELAGLKKQYAHALHGKTPSGALPSGVDEWLGDNYYILAREGAATLRALRTAAGLPLAAGGFPTLFQDCLLCCAGGELPPTEALIDFFAKRGLDAAETQYLELLLRTALLHLAWQVCKAQDAAALGAAIRSLRNIRETDFERLTEQTSALEKLLIQDPAGVYAQMDIPTRALYRRGIQQQSRMEGVAECDLAKRLLARAGAAGHIGSEIPIRPKKRRRGWLFLLLEALLPAALSVWLGFWTRQFTVAFLAYLPLWEALRPLLERLSLLCTPPSYLPRVKPESERAQAAKTLITVAGLLPDSSGAEKLRRRMLELFRSNAQGNIRVCMLLDMKGANTPERPEDRAAIAALRRVTAELNAQHGNAFYLAIRPRVFSPTQGNYTGRERKRGAIAELVRAIHGECEGFLVLDGDMDFFGGVRYLLALDSDTVLPMDTAIELVSVAVHPLNEAVVDEARGCVTAGYGVIVPRMENELFCEDATHFTRLLAGDGGITAYDSFASERYQDLFGEGIFAGKGLLDVAAFHALPERDFPPEQVLSHDILEGGYLRAGFCSDIQAADGFPRRQESYLARLHRWVRGDWQNLPFLYRKTPLTALSRWKLMDNLRRSLTPIASVAALTAVPFLPRLPAWVLLICTLLGVAGPGLLAFLRAAAAGGISAFSRLYYADVLPAALTLLLRTALNVLMLPQLAWCCQDAALRALWRLFVSRKKLLEWTTAAQSEQQRALWRQLTQCWPSVTAGGTLLLFGSPLLRLLGLFFLADIPFALLSAKSPRGKTRPLHYFEKEKMHSYAAAMWRYYEELCTAENNYLPPDNFQETPVYTVAQRSSPTNIGLGLLCTLAARDLGLIGTAELCRRLTQSLATVEKLEKWHGNLLNWYDTRTLAPLEPRYVSTVDSGNFLCALVALRQGLGEYAAQDVVIPSLMERIAALIAASDLSPLYHPRRRLFHIGMDLSTGELSPSFYDLLMSEARMTGYYAVASRTVPKKHWGAMGRMLVRDGRYTGPVSWTGTMFEYFMPALFLPAPRGSLGYEGLAFCLWCQRKRTAGKGIPWGVSESGFYAFDRQLNYQYKAHGVQKLGLKRGLDSELVISPYSSFLALQLAPRAALRNLQQLEKMEMCGRCGFYEAADFTPSRTGGQDYVVVRSYMAHHVGMGLLSVLNALRDNVLQKRFLADEKMACAAGLLSEKIPTGAVVFADVDLRETPPIRERVESTVRIYDDPNPDSPRVKLLTNGEWTSVLTDTGAGFSLYRGSQVTRHSRDTLRRPQGVFALFRYGEKLLPGSNALGAGDAQRFSASFAEDEVLHSAQNDLLRLTTRTQVHPRLPCEQKQYTLRNRSARETRGKLLIYLEPSLISFAQENEHPAFYKLFLQEEYDKANRLLHFTRRPRGAGHPLCMAAGLMEEVPFQYETARGNVLQDGKGIFSLLRKEPLLTGGRGNPDCCAAFSLELTLPPRSSRSVTLLMSCASTRSEAAQRLLRARAQGGIAPGKGALCPLAGGGPESVIAESVLPALFYAGRAGEKSLRAVAGNTLRGCGPLWSLGISGDYPIVCVMADTPEEVHRVRPYLLLNKRLRTCAVMTDLVLLYHEGGEYDTPVYAALRELLKKEGFEGVIGAAGGVHPVNGSLCGQETEKALLAESCFLAPDTTAIEREHFVPAELCAVVPETAHEKAVLPVKGGCFTAAGFTVNKAEKPAGMPWSHVLSNPSFGTMVSDSALGCSWAINSRENKLSPWFNDPCADNCGEMLLLRLGGKIYDLLEHAQTHFGRGFARWRGRAGELAYEINVTVPAKGMTKLCMLTLQNAGAAPCQAAAAYYWEPVLGVSRESAGHITGERLPGGALLQSAAGAVPGMAALCLQEGDCAVCFDRARFLAGDWAAQGALPNADPCAAICRRFTLMPGETLTLHFSLSFAANRAAALAMPVLAKFGQTLPALQIDTPDPALNVMVNHFLPEQIRTARLQGRIGFFQCGGAWGFRDQLQDVCAFLLTNPRLVKQQLLRCAAVQFEQGDVLHWWHRLPKSAGGLRGVRTKCRDDLLWLPLVCAEYVLATGDAAILDILVPFLAGEPLRADEHERYFEPKQSETRGTLYTHCIKSLECAALFGARGLSLIGIGDWNDGFNSVGDLGRGESVWLTQFYAMTLDAFAPLCEMQGDAERAVQYHAQAEKLRETVEHTAWDGDRYLRAFCDDGTPLGKRGNAECAIDSLPQSFAVFSGMHDPQRRKIALQSAVKALADEEHGIVKLFTPPFTGRGLRPGYVAAYPEGIRENGGQYTHAAVWLAMALLREGETSEGYRLLRMLNPADFCTRAQRAEAYRAEPYALAGDVSAAKGMQGRAGWSLYTGSAAWFYRAVTQELLGLRMHAGRIQIAPRLPTQWRHCTLRLRHGGKEEEIDLKNSYKP